MAIVSPIAELRRQVLEARGRAGLSPSERTVLLRSYRDEIQTVLGDVDRYLGDLDLERESDAIEQENEVWAARQNADIREQMLKRKLATPEQLDEIGLLSHERLDEMAEEHGTLAEALNLAGLVRGVLSGEALRKFNQMHPRGRGGKWIEVFGKLANLGEGDRAHIGKGVTVHKRGGQFHVRQPGGRVVHRGENIEKAAQVAHDEVSKPLRQPKPKAPESPGTKPSPDEQRKLWQERRAELETKVGEQVAKRSAEQEKELERGEAIGTIGPVHSHELTDAEVHFNAAGKISQHTLGRYAREAASQPTTLERYSKIDPDTGERVWSAERRAEHERIIDTLLRQMQIVDGEYVPNPEGDYFPSSEEPEVLFSGGGYAAGKGTVLKILSGRGDVPDSGYDGPVLTIDPDVVKAMLPEFQERIGTDPEANVLVYEEAWEIAQELQRRAIDKRMNMIVDGISNTSPLEMMERARRFTDAGYKARAAYVDIPTDEALRRALQRAQKAAKDSDKRYIPEVVMRAVHRDVASTVPELMRHIADGDVNLSLELFDNDQGQAPDGSFLPPRRIAVVEPGTEVSIEDDALWRRFRAKGFEEISGVDRPKGTESVGITPYREGETKVGEEEGLAPEDFFHSQRFREFENDLISMAKERGVTISSRDHVTGVWEGGSEPAYDVLLHDGDQVRGLVEELGRKYGQDAVITFTPGDGTDVEYVLKGVDPEKAQQAMLDAGIENGRLRGDWLEIISGDDIDDQIEQIREALGIKKVETRVGTFEFIPTGSAQQSS